MNYSRTVTFQPPASDLTGFPVLVRMINDRAMASRVSSASGFDVAFETSDGTTLPFELDFYDSATGTGAWWVKVPSISSTTGATIRMTYGDSSITTDQSAAASSVWPEGTYYEVLHYQTAGYPKCVFSRFNCQNIQNYELAHTSPIGRELSFPSSRGQGNFFGQFSDYPSFTYEGFGWAMGAMVVCRARNLTAGTGDLLPIYGQMRSCVTTSAMNFANDGTDYHSMPSSTAWMAFADSQYYQGGGQSMNTLVVNGTTVFTGTNGSNQCNNRNGRQYLPQTNSGATADVAEARFYSAYVPAAWMEYEQKQILQHSTFTNYGEERRYDGQPLPLLALWIPKMKVLD